MRFVGALTLGKIMAPLTNAKSLKLTNQRRTHWHDLATEDPPQILVLKEHQMVVTIPLA